ncbi:disulphide isomerase [Helicobacter mustelae]|uniref:DsbA family protein n=1 Tax=Helicobacter mustelae TaxID=217 RepID=UPI000E000BEB|nr:disulfide isomerase [Helicobacter mustelae]STP11980.1 disulphide isomerase [Helicobacter mustelae]
MKKISFIFLLSTLFLWAGTQENLKDLIKEKTKQDISIAKVYDLKGDDHLKIAILKDEATKNQIPVITNKDGNLLFVLTNVFFSKNDEDSKFVEELLGKIQSDNDKQVNSAALNKLFESIPEDYVIKLDSTTKNNKKVTYIVSDPMCPHCQEELRNIDKRLKDSNVYMVMVAYLGQESIKKAATILAKVKDAKSTKDKIALFQQVYSIAYRPSSADSKAVKKVENITKKVADSALIKGVPFIYEYTKQ